MSKASGMNGWSSKSKAKQAYLRRHGMQRERPTPYSSVDDDSLQTPPHMTEPPLRYGSMAGAQSVASRSHRSGRDGGLSVGSGLANISQHLLDVVTQYHMRIGSGASVSDLQSLQNRLLDEAEDCGVAGEWEAALNVYTHALAVSEKLAGIVRDRPEVAVQAAIVMHLGGCLHHLGELEAAGAYYEQSIQGLQRLRTPAYERWLVEAIGRVSGVAPPDITHARVQFLKSRILDVNLGRYPPESEYAGEVHSRWSSLGAKMRASGRCGKWRGDSAEGAGPTGEHAQPMYYEEEADDANDDAVAAVDLAESDADARPRPRPPTSSRAAALTAASRAQDAGIHATYGVA